MATETIRFDFAGGKELAAALRQLPADVAGEVLESALIAGATPIRDDAAARARIRRGPRRRPETVTLASTIRIVVREREGWRAAVDVLTKTPYAHLVEFGHHLVVGGQLGRRHVANQGPHKGKTIGGGHIIGHVPAYPFLRPAADENAEGSVRLIGTTLGPEIEAAFARRAPHEQA
jgi:bacteriophage HK97-gp10 putative tail-component